MPFYLYIPNDDGRGAGTIVGTFESMDDAQCEAALVGGRSSVIEAPKPTFGHLKKYVEAGWKKCEGCGRPNPPWRSET
jgi:hypothetical protein